MAKIAQRSGSCSLIFSENSLSACRNHSPFTTTVGSMVTSLFMELEMRQ
jgi:hypothetical protein